VPHNAPVAGWNAASVFCFLFAEIASSEAVDCGCRYTHGMLYISKVAVAVAVAP
jgi:hypothetical protein